MSEVDLTLIPAEAMPSVRLTVAEFLSELRVLAERIAGISLRIDAQERGVATALAAAEKAVTAALSAAEKAIAAAMAAAEKAVSKAEAAAEKRFEGVNEFRQSLSDQQQTFARKTEVEIRFAGIDDKFKDLSAQLNAISEWRSRIAGGAATGDWVARAMFGVIGAAVPLLIWFLSK